MTHTQVLGQGQEPRKLQQCAQEPVHPTLSRCRRGRAPRLDWSWNEQLASSTVRVVRLAAGGLGTAVPRLTASSLRGDAGDSRSAGLARVARGSEGRTRAASAPGTAATSLLPSGGVRLRFGVLGGLQRALCGRTRGGRLARLTSLPSGSEISG